MQVDTNVTEGDVGKLRDGMRASFSVDAYANERFNGVIQQIRNAATTVQNVVTYDAVIEVENSDLKLRPGMTANATINYDRREGVLRVPNGALRFRPPPSLASALPAGSASAPPPPGLPPAADSSAPAPAASGAAGAAPVPSAAASAGAHTWGHDGRAAPAGSAGRQHRGGRGAADTATKYLWVLRSTLPGALPVPVPVRTGLTDGSYTEVVSGEVNEGDAVVLEATSGDEPVPASNTKAPGGQQAPRMRL
jgi:HlyD family secretion protein